MSNFIMQRRSLVQVLLISLLALILTMSILLGGVLLWQGRAEGIPPYLDKTPTPIASEPSINVAPTTGGFRVQGSNWPGFTELTLSVVPVNALTAAVSFDLGSVVANAKGNFSATFTWNAVDNRREEIEYELVAKSVTNDTSARAAFNLSNEIPNITITPPVTVVPNQPFCSVVADTLNVRSGPGTSYSIVTGLVYQSTVRPLARTASNEWIQVATEDEISGWVTASYIECNVNISDLPIVQTPQPTATRNPTIAAVAITPTQGWAGTFINVSGANWQANTTIHISLSAPGTGPTSDVYAKGDVDAEGRFTASFAFPEEERWLGLPQVIVVAHTVDYQRTATATFNIVRPAPQITDWKGEYFNNRTLTGTPALVRNDTAVDFNWGSAAPAIGLPADNFAVRWTRTIRFESGDYRFYARSDDGVRVWLDNWLVVDQWNDGGAGLRVGDFQGVGSGEHTVRIEYYEAQGDAFATVWWERTGPITEWRGEYFNNPNLDDIPALVRNDKNVDFDWEKGSPSPILNADKFSARWTRKLNFTDGMYRFTVKADDGVRLWVDGETVLDAWHSSDDETLTATLPLTKGAHTIKVEFYENIGNAHIQVEWERVGNLPPTQPQIIITTDNADEFAVSGAGWQPNTEVNLSLQTFPENGETTQPYKLNLGSVETDGKGRFKITYAWPKDLPDAVYLVATSGKFEVKVILTPQAPVIKPQQTIKVKP